MGAPPTSEKRADTMCNGPLVRSVLTTRKVQNLDVSAKDAPMNITGFRLQQVQNSDEKEALAREQRTCACNLRVASATGGESSPLRYHALLATMDDGRKKVHKNCFELFGGEPVEVQLGTMLIRYIAD